MVAVPDNFVPVKIPSAGHFKDLRGQRFGMLVVKEYAGIRDKNSTWYCVCDCGQASIVLQPSLRNGNSRSCGCLRAADIKTRHITHGHTVNRDIPAEYNTWVNMRDRCNNPKNNRYYCYGARGITVCKRWEDGDGKRSKFACFIEDMGWKPSSKHSIDRIDVDGNYEPSNCRWATPLEQAANKRKKAVSIVALL